MNRELREDRDSWRQLAQSLRAELKEAQERVNERDEDLAALWRIYHHAVKELEKARDERDQLKGERDELLAEAAPDSCNCEGPCDHAIEAPHLSVAIDLVERTAYRQGFEDCREAAAIAADEYAEKCMLYDETDGIEKEAIGCVIRALSVPEREVK